MSYEEYYEYAKHQNGGTFRGLDVELHNLDPYEVLGVPKRFTWDQLKDAYRQKAKLVHPDKGGTQELFTLVTDCFRSLAEEYKRNVEAKSHSELKKAFTQETEATRITKRTDIDQDEEFYKRFNKMFEENKLEDDETATGYGHIMAESSAKRDDISIPMTMKKYNNEKFNKQFEKHVPAGKDVVVYKEPQPLTLAKTMAYTELGGKTDDFSSSVERGEKRGLVYSDYMRAHTTSRLIDPRTVQQRIEYKNVEEYDMARAKALASGVTEDERKWQEERDELEQRREHERLERLKQRDHAISQHYERVNGLLMQ
jgi:molybdenum-dependent DNA-binding transcriptional regulator ModE